MIKMKQSRKAGTSYNLAIRLVRSLELEDPVISSDVEKSNLLSL